MALSQCAIWLPLPSDYIDEDPAYLLGYLKATCRAVHVTLYDVYADDISAPDDPLDLVVQLHSVRSLDMVQRIGDIAAARGVPVTNPTDAMIRNFDKRNLPRDFPELTPDTQTARAPDDLARLFEVLGGDIVVKPPTRGRGEYIERFTHPIDAEAAKRLFDASGTGDLVVQPYCAGLSAGDLRIYVAKGADGTGDILGQFRRRPPPGGWKSNLSAGGTMEPATLTPQEADLAQKIFARSGLDFVGIDLGYHDGKPLLIELNPTAGGVVDLDLRDGGTRIAALAQMFEQMLQTG